MAIAIIIQSTIIWRLQKRKFKEEHPTFEERLEAKLQEIKDLKDKYQ